MFSLAKAPIIRQWADLSTGRITDPAIPMTIHSPANATDVVGTIGAAAVPMIGMAVAAVAAVAVAAAAGTVAIFNRHAVVNENPAAAGVIGKIVA
jgi:hypothetical protein